MSTTELIQHFYTSFQNGDAKGMIECYDDNIVFEDPAFGRLIGEDAKSMWKMLLDKSNGDLKIIFSDIQCDNRKGSAKWIAQYTFTPTGRPVINEITAEFDFYNGKITHHTDHFSLWKWSGHALGNKGWLLGWTGFMKRKIQAQTNAALMKYKKTN